MRCKETIIVLKFPVDMSRIEQLIHRRSQLSDPR